MLMIVCAKCAREMARNHPAYVRGGGEKGKCQVCGKPALCRLWDFHIRSHMVAKEC